MKQVQTNKSGQAPDTTRIRVGGSPSPQNNCNYQAGDAMLLELGYRAGAAHNGDVVSQGIQPLNVSQTFGHDRLGRLNTFRSTVQRGVWIRGYEKWYHPDGSRVHIGADGAIDRVPPSSAGKVGVSQKKTTLLVLILPPERVN